MKEYVVGFAFNDSAVLLIKKERPKWQKGLYNGLGGHIEKNEQPIAAMVREFREECGIDTTESQWEEFATMKGSDWICYCFWARNTFDLCNAKQMTDEELMVINAYTLHIQPTISNIPALVGLAMDNFKPKSVVFDYSEALPSTPQTGRTYTEQEMIYFANKCRGQFVGDRSTQSLFNEFNSKP